MWTFLAGCFEVGEFESLEDGCRDSHRPGVCQKVEGAGRRHGWNNKSPD